MGKLTSDYPQSAYTLLFGLFKAVNNFPYVLHCRRLLEQDKSIVKIRVNPLHPGDRTLDCHRRFNAGSGC